VRAGLFLAWRVYFEIELYAMLFLVMCKSLLCAFYFEIELYAMLFFDDVYIFLCAQLFLFSFSTALL
jgi:hypothetical protein